MSLFGTPPESSRQSLFDDEDNAPGASPWQMPTPRKGRPADLVRALLADVDVPSGYRETFDAVHHNDAVGEKISLAGVTKVLSAARLSADAQTKIVGLLAGEQDNGRLGDLDRGAFHVLLALIGLAQEGEEIHLDAVDERRKNLPVPTLTGLEIKESVPTIVPQEIPASTMNFSEADPWASPEMHRGHDHARSVNSTQGVKSTASNVSSIGRTTSGFTTAGLEESKSSLVQETSARETSTSNAAGEVWGSFGGISPEPPVDILQDVSSRHAATIKTGTDRSTMENPTRNNARSTNNTTETITVTLLPEKEGIFMFQHHNYQVTSIRRGSQVVRRYSDFVWLLDCLHKRYPFRQLPLLPPKRVAVNGNHLAADSTFIEKRRRGLVRFTNALIRHPVLGQEQLVTMFLTVPTELAVWRKQANLSVQEEFAGKSLPPGLEDSLSPTLNDLFDATRTGVRRSAEVYIHLCNLMDRLSKRTEGLAADHLRLALSLQTLTDASHDTYATDTNEVPLLNEGLQATAKHVSNCQTLLEDEARAWDQGVLEDLKTQRDALVSLRDMFERRERYDRDNIPQLEKRIQSNESKLISIRNKPDGMVKPGEVEKVTEAIIKDKESIVAQHARGVFVLECVRDELLFFQSTQYAVSRLHQHWAQERVKYSELQADNWKQLLDQLEAMPIE